MLHFPQKFTRNSNVNFSCLVKSFILDFSSDDHMIAALGGRHDDILFEHVSAIFAWYNHNIDIVQLRFVTMMIYAMKLRKKYSNIHETIFVLLKMRFHLTLLWTKLPLMNAIYWSGTILIQYVLVFLLSILNSLHLMIATHMQCPLIQFGAYFSTVIKLLVYYSSQMMI